jgi:hypothetical protein
MVIHELIVISALIYYWDCDFWDYNLFTNIQRKNYDFYKCLEVCVFFLFSIMYSKRNKFKFNKSDIASSSSRVV